MDKVHQQSWEKGLNKDLNTENVQGQFFDCHNLRINSVDGTQFVGLTNDLKNYKVTELPEGHIIIGGCHLRDIFVIFSTQTNNELGGQGWIWSFSINKITEEIQNLTLVYSNFDLRFTTKHPIKAFGNYENDQYQRVYFSDYFNKTRSVNLAKIQLDDNIEALSLFLDIQNSAPYVKDIIPGGSLPVGIYEYFYTATTFDGKESLFSPNSTQIHIVTSLESLGNTIDYKGSPSTDGADKAVRVVIDLSTVPTGLFQKVTLHTIFKAELNDIPTVIKIEEKLVNSLNPLIEFTHSSNELSSSTLDFDDYFINQYPFYTNKCFAIKDNSLVVSNVKNKSFDMGWETQCFRYKYDGILAIRHEPYKNYFNDETGTAYGDRPTGVYADWLSTDQYMFQPDGVTLGGQSLDQSIKYKFVLREIGSDNSDSEQTYFTANGDTTTENTNGQTIINPSFNSFHSPFTRNLKGLKRGEVYRYGIVGRRGSSYSFVGYIGDIKAPELSTPAGYETIAGTGIDYFPISTVDGDNNVKLWSLGLEFTITVPDNIDIDSFEIVRVPRTSVDKTRICSGVISKFFEQSGGASGTGIHFAMSDINDIEQYYASGAQSDIPYQWQNKQSEFDRKDLIGFFSPEVTYNHESPASTGNTYLKTNGILINTGKWNPNGLTPYGSQRWGSTSPDIAINIAPTISNPTPVNGDPRSQREFITKGRVTNPTTNYNQEFHWEKIKSFQRQDPSFGNDVPFAIEGLDYRNYSFDTGNNTDTPKGAYNGTCLICKMDAGDVDLFDSSPSTYQSGVLGRPWSNYYGSVMMMDFVKLKQDQYGGLGVENISYNNFISITNSINASGTIVEEVFGGDTYVSMFEFMKNFWDNSLDDASFYEAVVLPIETTVNIDLNHGKTFTRGAEFEGEHFRAQESGMFTYNTVFSSEFMSRYYQTKPFDFIENNTFDVRNYLSDPKIIGETVDSWAKFRPNNFLDLEANQGPITETHSYMDEVFFLQENGVGYISINPRAITTTSDGVPTELGTATGLQNYVYLSKNSGSIHQWSSGVFTNTLYYYDANRQCFNRLNGTTPENLSTVKGMDSYFKNLIGNILLTKKEGGDNPIENAGVILGYNPKYEELYITTLSNDAKFENENRTTLVYNPRWDSFRDFPDFTPNIYIDNKKFLISPSDVQTNLNSIYLYNKGVNCIFFDKPVSESSVSFYVNDLSFVTKVIKGIQYDISVKDASNNYISTEGLTHIRIQNDYQDTGKVSLASRQRNRFNVWKIKKIPRNILQANKISRVRNDWHLVTLYYDNSSGNTINLERVLTIYVPQ